MFYKCKVSVENNSGILSVQTHDSMLNNEKIDLINIKDK